MPRKGGVVIVKPEIIIALDVPNRKAVEETLARLPESLVWYKVGLELFCAEGPGVLEPLKEAGRKIFLDLKLHDIPRTVERAVRSIARWGVDLTTLHASGGPAMIAAAAEAAAGSESLNLLAVTVLTSLSGDDLRRIGLNPDPAEQVRTLAAMALDAGADGLVCSPLEVKSLRDQFGPTPLMVTPGIRLPTDAAGDQKRIATPGDAARDGASHLVIGRPILAAADPAAAVEAIRASIDASARG
jgi:orotidine-5'-phosphate decarboxylase